MGEKAGVQETKEALQGILEVSVALAEIFKDGAQLSDIAAIYAKFVSDDALRGKIQKATEDIGKIPAELSDLDLREMIELGTIASSFVPRLIDVLRGK